MVEGQLFGTYIVIIGGTLTISNIFHSMPIFEEPLLRDDFFKAIRTTLNKSDGTTRSKIMKVSKATFKS